MTEGEKYKPTEEEVAVGENMMSTEEKVSSGLGEKIFGELIEKSGLDEKTVKEFMESIRTSPALWSCVVGGHAIQLSSTNTMKDAILGGIETFKNVDLTLDREYVSTVNSRRDAFLVQCFPLFQAYQKLEESRDLKSEVVKQHKLETAFDALDALLK